MQATAISMVHGKILNQVKTNLQSDVENFVNNKAETILGSNY